MADKKTATPLRALTQTNWTPILLCYGIILLGTYLARKQVNVLNLLLQKITTIHFPFNYNHGLATIVVALVFYKLSTSPQQITLLGNKKAKSLLFPVTLFACYTLYGINNNQGVNPHLWALVFCAFAFVYNILEEYAWRGYLTERLGKLNYVLKSVISGVFWAIWHLFVFSNFDQYGGFAVFLIFCIVFSFILTFAVLRTKSIIVAAAIHTFIVQTNLAALICLAIFAVLLFSWNKRIPGKRPVTSEEASG
jgi:membrane protease YdiL (CAAX protease family)